MAGKKHNQDKWGMGKSASDAANQGGQAGDAQDAWNLPTGRNDQQELSNPHDPSAWRLPTGNPDAFHLGPQYHNAINDLPEDRSLHLNKKVILPLLALACVVAILTVALFLSGQRQYVSGQIQVHKSEQDGVFQLALSYTIEDLDPTMAYLAGYMMAPDGEFYEAISEPTFIFGKETFQLTAEVTLQREGDYQLMLYYYPLTETSIRTTRPQTVTLRYAAVPLVTPGGQAWYTLPTATPTAAPTATPSPTPSPVPTATPTATPTAAPTLRPDATPTEAPATPRPTATPQPTAPTSARFWEYAIDTRYFYHQLTTNEKRLFAELYDGVMNFETEIHLKGNYTEAEFDRVGFMLIYDCPELFHLGAQNGEAWHWSLAGDRLTVVEYSYTMSAAEYERTYAQVMEKIRSMQNQPGFGPSDFSKQFVIYQYLIEHNDYNLSRPYCGVANSAWLLGYAKCSGYTRALNLALRYYGIQCCEIRGNTYDNGVMDPGSHLWTGVKLDGQWYHCDATWDDPIGFDAFGYEVAILPYLNITDEKMMRARSLHEDLVFDVPDCRSTRYNYYQTLGVVVSAGANAKSTVHSALTKAHRQGEDFFVLAFDSTRDYATVSGSIRQYVNSWQNGSAEAASYSLQCWPEANLILVFNIRYR